MTGFVVQGHIFKNIIYFCDDKAEISAANSTVFSVTWYKNMFICIQQKKKIMQVWNNLRVRTWWWFAFLGELTH